MEISRSKGSTDLPRLAHRWAPCALAGVRRPTGDAGLGGGGRSIAAFALGLLATGCDLSPLELYDGGASDAAASGDVLEVFDGGFPLSPDVGGDAGQSPRCGDGRNDPAEACDDGNTSPGDGCDPSCMAEPGFSCGGALTPCRAICGDGLMRASETCDDGNEAAGDGCSAECSEEFGFSCRGEPSLCAAVCGDGILRGGEVCDDGKSDAGDGCSGSCSVEPGYACRGEPSACEGVCGDGIIRGNEACDDGNRLSRDGCDAICSLELGFSCVREPSLCFTSSDAVFVDKSGPSCTGTSGGAGSASNPYCTIMAGVGASGKRVILVRPGLYPENVTIGSGVRDLVAVSTATIAAPGRALQVRGGAKVTVRGFAMTSGTDTCVELRDTGTRGSLFDNEIGSCDERGVYAHSGAWVELARNVIRENGQEGVYLDTDAGYRIVNNVIVSNGFRGVEIRRATPTSLFRHNTIAANALGGVSCIQAASIVNSVVWGNGEEALRGSCQPSFSNLDRMVRGAGNFTLDPHFVDGRYHISVTSPCYARGDPSAGEALDFEGNLRAYADGVDVGADEASPVEGCGDGVSQGEACDDRNVTNGDGCSAGCTLEAGWICAGTPSSCSTVCGDGFVTGREQCDDGNCSAGDGCGEACEVEVGHDCIREPSLCFVASTVVHVDAGSALCPGSGTKTDPYCSLTSAVTTAGRVIFVRAGDYLGNDGLTFRGGETILIGDAAARLVYTQGQSCYDVCDPNTGLCSTTCDDPPPAVMIREGARVTLRGFEEISTVAASCVVVDGVGTQATILENRMHSCAGYGIVGQNGARVSIERTVVRRSGLAGAYLGGGDHYVVNTVFANNASDGVVMARASSSAVFANNTVVENGARGISCNASAQGLIQNTILWRNATSPVGTACIVEYSDADQVLTGAGNFSSDPLLDADYRIGPASPCVDAGDPRGVAPAGPAPPNDIFGTPRPLGNGVDVGAFEAR